MLLTPQGKKKLGSNPQIFKNPIPQDRPLSFNHNYLSNMPVIAVEVSTLIRIEAFYEILILYWHVLANI